MASKVTPARANLTDLSVALVGPGRVGRSLGTWLRRTGATVDWLVGRDPAGTRDAAQRLDATVIPIEQVMARDWNLLLLTPPDRALAGLVASLAATASTRMPGRVALHTSGSQSADVLAKLRGTHMSVGGFHPLLGFHEVRADPVGGVVYGVDGDPAAVEVSRRLAAAFEGEIVEVATETRLLYHYCATLAAGGITTTLAAVDELSSSAGLEPAIRRGFLRLSQAAVEAARERPDAALAITGPIARGDLDLAQKQLLGAAEKVPELRSFLAELHSQTARQVRRARHSAGETTENKPPGE